MVTKAIERAQNTVEPRNAEIRKNVLKYDEVMNEQRKVIYKRRDQILEGADLKEEAMEYLADAVDTTIDTFCVAEFSEEWDLDGLVTEMQTFWPSKVTTDTLREAGSTDAMYDLLMSEASAHYEEREADLGEDNMREVERQVMLRIIDQRWREHLYEMDYLQEGINLRAMGQKDPLVEWQREGYSMFSEMMHGIAQDFVRYVMHVQVVVNEEQPQDGVRNVQYSAADDPVQGTGGMRAAAMAALADGSLDAEQAGTAVAAAEPVTMAPVVKSDWDKTPRNAPCPCGSGKKFKLCHGR
jgi:preprotein translocase subunit SecA